MHVQNEKCENNSDKWGFRHACHVATATPNLKDFHNDSNLWTCSHMDISRVEKKMLAF